MTWIRGLALVAICGGTIRCGPPSPDLPAVRAAAANASVVILTLDTTRADRLGCYGYREARTPHLDQFAAEGIRVERALAPAPITLPSHASLMTGQTPAEHGVRDNGLHRVPPEVETLAETLKDRGYRTAAFLSAHVLSNRYGLDQGFDHYDDRMDGRDPRVLEPIERRAADTVDAALAWMQAHREGPRFLWLHFFDPHFPYEAPRPFSEQMADPYDAEISYLDAQIGRFFERYQALDPTDNTLFVVTADHGEGLMDHQEATHGLFLYDTTLHVPLLMKHPALGAAKTVTGQVGLVDVAPTVLDLLGLPPRDAVGGRSFLAAIVEGTPADHEVYLETHLPQLSFGLAPMHGVCTMEAKYIDAPRPELYQWPTDPGETLNLLPKQAARAEEFRQRMEELRGEQSAGEAEPPLPFDPEELERLEALGYLRAEAPEMAGVDPKDAVEWVQAQAYATHLLQTGDNQQAVQILQRVVELCPGNATAHAHLGEAKLAMKQFAQAREHLEKALSLRPDLTFATFRLAQTHHELGDKTRALEAYELLLSRFPDMGKAYLAAARTCLEHSDPEGARAYLQRGLSKLPPDNASVPKIRQRLQQLDAP